MINVLFCTIICLSPVARLTILPAELLDFWFPFPRQGEPIQRRILGNISYIIATCFMCNMALKYFRKCKHYELHRLSCHLIVHPESLFVNEKHILNREQCEQVKLSWTPRSPWQPLVVWLPHFHADIPVHVPGESCSSCGPGPDVQQVSGWIRDVDPGSTVPLYEAFGPACCHQGDLSTGKQCYPPLWCHWLSNTNAHLDQNFSLFW